MSSTESGVVTGGPASGYAGDSVSGSVKDMASSAMDTVTRDAMAMASTAQDKAARALEHRKQAVGGTMEDFASAIRKAGEDLSESDQTMAARLVRQAADGLEHLSHSLADRRPHEILDAARDFGRRNPFAFAAGAVLLGVALGRVARSTGADASAQGYSSASPGVGETDGVPAYGEEGFTAAGEYATAGGSAPQEEMVLIDAASDVVDPGVSFTR
ncbi:MAG TPA: hypothetical protein VH353_02085 [Caulobacteraceae bacterium]|nr:hypothetical protein [Caulobacteraceae bacterium]